MGERKVLNKYYPPDFDPTLIPRNRKPKDRKYTVNLMMPMTIQCSACGQFMYMGKKVNGMKEMVNGESYLGIAIHRCVECKDRLLRPVFTLFEPDSTSNA
jgi:hypothetical protein